MQTYTRFLIPMVSLLSLSAATVQAADGVIHFRGQIVETPCDYQSSSRQLNVNCYRDGKNHLQTIPMQTLLQGGHFVNDTSMASLRWIDRAKNTAVLTVEYK